MLSLVNLTTVVVLGNRTARLILNQAPISSANLDTKKEERREANCDWVREETERERERERDKREKDKEKERERR